jgi:hypothetical protein
MCTFNVGGTVYHDAVQLQFPRTVPARFEVDSPLMLDQVDGVVSKKQLETLLVEMSAAWFNPARGGVDAPPLIAAATVQSTTSRGGKVDVSQFLQKVAVARCNSYTGKITIAPNNATVAAEVDSRHTSFKWFDQPFIRANGTPAGVKYLHGIRMLQESARTMASSWADKMASQVTKNERSLLVGYGGVVKEEAAEVETGGDTVDEFMLKKRQTEKQRASIPEMSAELARINAEGTCSPLFLRALISTPLGQLLYSISPCWQLPPAPHVVADDVTATFPCSLIPVFFLCTFPLSL